MIREIQKWLRTVHVFQPMGMHISLSGYTILLCLIVDVLLLALWWWS